MIVTNYGLDNALCQVIYKRLTNRDDYMTVSPRNINDYLRTYRPNVLIGFNNINTKFLKENNLVIIDNTKRAIETYNNYPKFVGGLKLSKTKIFNDLLSKKIKSTSELKFVALASKVAAYDYDEASVSILELYDTIGHDQFVSRLLANDDLVLSPKEQELVSRMKNHKELIIYHSLDDIVLKDEDRGIYIARISYSMSRAYTDVLFSKYQDDVKLIVYWDYSADGDIRVYMKSAQGAISPCADFMYTLISPSEE